MISSSAVDGDILGNKNNKQNTSTLYKVGIFRNYWKINIVKFYVCGGNIVNRNHFFSCGLL